jgi:Flp pilus assembly protein TadB
VTLVTAVIVGAVFGVGVTLIIRALRPGPTPLARALADLEAPPVATPTRHGDSGLSPGLDRLGTGALWVLDTVGLSQSEALRLRLRALDKPVERHAFDKVAGAVAGLLIPVAFAVVLAAFGVDISAAFIGIAAVGLATVGFLYPDLGLAEAAERRRRSFRHALSAYLDLVTVILAGGGGLETALQSAADAGDGWAFAEIRGALQKARVTNSTPWESFDELGDELGVDELRELAASAQLAGDQGARIRASLAVKADSMRTHQTASIEAQGEVATEKMLLPVVALVVGMILFIGFGVIQAISVPGAGPIPTP